MKSLRRIIIGLFCLVIVPALSGAETVLQKPLMKFDASKPVLLVTAEYLTVDQLTDPKLLALLKKYDVMVAPCIRAGKMDADLDRLFDVYEANGLTLVFWPLLPREQGLYLNKKHADDFLKYLDEIYAWAEKYHHPVQALIVDIEPPNYQKGTDAAPEEKQGGGLGIGPLIKTLDQQSFEEARWKFQAILDKLHAHGTIGISTAMDLSVVDILTGMSAWQDFQGGPTMAANWDYVSFMHFGSNNYPMLHSMFKMNWDDCRWMTYRIGEIIYSKYGDKVAVSTGQTLPGEGHGAVYNSPEELAEDFSVLRAAGIRHFGIYDLQGIIEREDPEAWFKAVREAPAKTPEKSWKAENALNTFKCLSYMLEMFR